MEEYLIKLFCVVCIACVVSCSSELSQENTDNSLVNNPAQGLWQEANQSPLKFEQLLTIGNNIDLILPASYQIIGPVTDDEDNIYFIDAKKGRMFSFSSQGNLRWSKGNEGKGPGDFENPRGLVTDGANLYTANVQGSRIDQFDLEGNLIETTPLENLDLSFSSVEGFISDTLMVLSSTLWGKAGAKINLLNTRDNLDNVSQFDLIPVELDFGEGLSQSVNISIMDTMIVAGNFKTYALQFYNTNGKKVKTITKQFDKLVRPGFYQQGESRGIGGFGGLNAPTALSNGYFITTLSWPTNIGDPDEFLKQLMEKRENAKQAIYKNAIDLFDKKGNLLYTLQSDGETSNMGTITHVDSDGNIYTKSNTPFPQIRKYKVTVTPPGNQKK